MTNVTQDPPHGFEAVGHAEANRSITTAHDLAEFARLHFDAEWYKAQNPDVVQAGYDPLEHYLKYGCAEGRHPSRAAWQQATLAEMGRESFDPEWYAAHNPDVIAAGHDPLQHYLDYGRREGRPGRPRWEDAGDDRSPDRPPLCWFFLGDTIEWIAVHDHLTGVGRVTSEILFAGLSEAGPRFLPCVRGTTPSGLGKLTDWDAVAALARIAGRPEADAATAERAASLLDPRTDHPARGDHVIFTGVIWSPAYALLSRQLVRRGITYSVLINDIIPVTQPEYVSKPHARFFTDWLRATVQTASVIYVTTEFVGREIARWCVDARLPTTAAIRQIPFGSRPIVPETLATDSSRGRTETAPYVLCVGTIDDRKNQRMLCRLWADLLARDGADNVPHLVLVGRDDIDLAVDVVVAPLIQDGRIKIYSGLTDPEVAALYRGCLFTVFPSTSEGYGLPVAESLAYGKLCVSAGLPVVRSHAGDLAWYFDPTSCEEASAQIRRAIDRPEERMAAERRILAEYRGAAWSETVDAMMVAANAVMSGRPVIDHDVLSRFARPQTKRADSSEDQGPIVSIVVINHNTVDAVLACVRQVWSHTIDVTYEIIVIDNGSIEEDLRRLRILAPLLKLIEIGCDRYQGEAYNIAAERARGQWLCFLDPSVDVGEDWLSTALTASSYDAAVAVIGFFPSPLDLADKTDASGSEPSANKTRLRRDSGPSIARVDAVSAEALIVDRAVFLASAGFDFAYEPGGYEDVDLCLKIRMAGRGIVLMSDGPVSRSRAPTSDVTDAKQRLAREINRDKLFTRWGAFLAEGEHRRSARNRQSALFKPSGSDRSLACARPQAVLYTPYALAPGGGERYILTMAAVLAETHEVTIGLPHLYSKLRLVALGEEFGLDLSSIDLEILSDELRSTLPDIMVCMNNQAIPAIRGFGKKNFFMCQFPFPMPAPITPEDKAVLSGYRKIIANSRYTEIYLESTFNNIQAASVPVDIVHPPVDQIAPDVKRPNTILTVGRFFQGGHAKRQDVLIEAFKLLLRQSTRSFEFHIVGSTLPEENNMSYLYDIRKAAAGYPIHFHVNAQPEELERLYATCEAYWHGAGIGADLAQTPGAAEHFGISVVEAMTAGTVPFGFAAGGPREIIQHGTNGFLYDSVETLIDRTQAFFALGDAEKRALSAAAQRRGRDFSSSVFAENIRRVVLEEEG